MSDGDAPPSANPNDPWPGDAIVPVVVSENGVVLWGTDARDGSSYEFISPQNKPPASVEFTDPGFGGDVFGAVSDTQGVCKFTTRIAPGEVLGIEKRDGNFFADTQRLAVAVLAIGGRDVGRNASVEDHRWHVFDETLEPQDMHTSASGFASALLSSQRAAFRARSLMFPMAELIGSTVESDVLAGSPRRKDLMARLTTARDNAARWGKELMVGWIQLNLLDGAPDTPQTTAREHYGMVGKGIRLEAAEATGQAVPPALIVNQGFGVRTDGSSEVILAEGRLDLDFYSIGFIVPTPLYPFPLVKDTLATLTPDALLMVRELEVHAVTEIGAGRDWFCPSLEEATLHETTVTAKFMSLSPLVLKDPENHGFSFAQDDAPQIKSVTVAGKLAKIELAAPPTGALTVQYAFGQHGDAKDGFPINRGSVTDTWSHASNSVAGAVLHRYARAGRAPVKQGPA